MASELEHVAWESCAVELQRDRALDSYARRKMGVPNPAPAHRAGVHAGRPGAADRRRHRLRPEPVALRAELDGRFVLTPMPAEAVKGIAEPVVTYAVRALRE